MARNVKSAKEKAEIALYYSERRLSRFTKKRDTLAAEIKALDDAIDAERRARDYLALNPALSPVAAEPGSGGTE